MLELNRWGRSPRERDLVFSIIISISERVFTVAGEISDRLDGEVEGSGELRFAKVGRSMEDAIRDTETRCLGSSNSREKKRERE